MKVLFIGESWFIHMIHAKGYDTFESSKYEEGATHLLECLRGAGVDVDYMPSHEIQIRFPTDINELEKYDAIVISDVGANTFLLQNDTFYNMKTVPNALSLIEEYTRNGGGLLMIGGYLSFAGIEAKAYYQHTVLAEVLPIKMKDHDDRVEFPEGVNPVTTDEKHFITKDIKDWPRFLGYNQFSAKQDAKVLAKVNNDPFLVVGEYQQGKTACFASDCAPHWGSPDFMNWEKYTDLWVDILKYVGNQA